MSNKQVDTSTASRLRDKPDSNPLAHLYETNYDIFNGEWALKQILRNISTNLLSDGLVFKRGKKYFQPSYILNIVSMSLISDFCDEAVRQKALYGYVVYTIRRVSSEDSVGRHFPVTLGYPYPEVVQEGMYVITEDVSSRRLVRKVSWAGGGGGRNVYLFESGSVSRRTLHYDDTLLNRLKPKLLELFIMEKNHMVWSDTHAKPPIVMNNTGKTVHTTGGSAIDMQVEATRAIYLETNAILRGADAISRQRIIESDRVTASLSKKDSVVDVIPPWKRIMNAIYSDNSRVFVPDGFLGAPLNPPSADGSYSTVVQDIIKQLYLISGLTMRTRRSQTNRTDDEPHFTRDLSESTLKQWGVMFEMLLKGVFVNMWKRIPEKFAEFEDEASDGKAGIMSLSEVVNETGSDDSIYTELPESASYFKSNKEVSIYLKSVLMRDPMEANELRQAGVIDNHVYQLLFPETNLAPILQAEKDIEEQDKKAKKAKLNGS